MLFAKIILSILPLVSLINPKLQWKITEVWKYKKNAEPSTAYLVMIRISSLITLILLWSLIPNKF